jgi:hypothetical protein
MKQTVELPRSKDGYSASCEHHPATSVATLGLLGGHVRSQGNRDRPSCLSKGKSEEHAAMQRKKD